MRVEITAAMRSNAVGAWGAAGETWLARLPTLVRELSQEWGLQRVAAWGYVKAVLSEVWSHEDGATGRSRAFDVADRLWPGLP